MTSHSVAARPVLSRAGVSRWLVSAAVAAAVAGSSFSLPAFAAESEELAEVTVTGSRIVRRDLEAASPVVTVSTEQFDRSSTTSLETTLNQLPQFAPAGSQFVSGAQSGPTSTPGAATLNLRGIGANRNLVLIDGRRPQPANASLVVDINTIPQSAIQGVEVITGGASAVYGPDAIAGVTNFLLKRDFQGLSLDVQTGITQEGDGSDTKVSALMGMNAADGKGNIMVGLDYAKRGAVYQRDRDFFVDGWRDTRNADGDFIQRAAYVATGNAPTQAAVNTVLPVAGVSPTSIFYFNGDGSAFVADRAIGYTGPYNQLSAMTSGNRVGDRDDMMTLQASGLLDQRYTTAHLSTPAERHSLFLKGNYEINEYVNTFVQANYVNSKVTTRGNYAPAVTLWSVSIPRDDIVHTGTVAGGPTVAANTSVKRTLPAELVTLLNSRTRTVNGNPVSAANEPWQLYQVPQYFGALEATNTSNVWQMLVGMNGKMGISDWTYETYFARGTTKTDAEIPMPSLQRYQLLAAAPNFGANALGTNAIIGPASPGGRGYSLSCTSGLPIFNEFTPSADCLKSMEIRGKQLTLVDQDTFEANMQGRGFDLPAGEARFALGVAYRKNSFRFDPSYPVESVLDNPIGLFASNATKGSTNVKELYGELLAPVLPGLDLELGYRLSDFNTAGTEGTWKALFTWKALDGVSFRGGYQVATRAPNTAELFAGDRLEVVGFPGVDPCSAATDHAWGNRLTTGDAADVARRLKVQAVCRAWVNQARGVALTDTTSLYDTQTFNTNVTVNGRLMGAGANGFTRQNPPYFPLEIETEKGNPNLNPEKAKTITLGTIITDPFGLRGLTATIDAYQIHINDTIARLSSFTAYYNCLNANGTSNPTYDFNNTYCQLIDRNGTTGDRENVDSLFLNLGKVRTRGIDVSLGWRGDVGPGTLTAGTAINYLLQYKYQPDSTAPFRDAKGTLDQGGQYDYRALTTVGYSMGAFDVGMQWRFLPGIDAADKALLPNTTVGGAGAYSQFNLTGGWDLGTIKLRAGIDNVLNRRLPIVGENLAVGDTNSNQTNLSFYDGLGRRFFIGAKATF